MARKTVVDEREKFDRFTRDDVEKMTKKKLEQNRGLLEEKKKKWLIKLSRFIRSRLVR